MRGSTSGRILLEGLGAHVYDAHEVRLADLTPAVIAFLACRSQLISSPTVYRRSWGPTDVPCTSLGLPKRPRRPPPRITRSRGLRSRRYGSRLNFAKGMVFF